MSSKVNWLITDHNVTVNYNGQTHIISRNDGLADRLIAAIKAGDWNKVPTLVSAAKRIEKYSKGAFTVVDGRIMVNGVEAPAALGNKILKFSNEGLPYNPLVRFAEKLQQNPSFRAVNELFTFLEKNDHPITETGNFIAYKRVRSDFKDIYSGKFDNSVGNVVEVNRNQVDEDCTVTCSHGLHVANWDYAHNIYSQATNDVMLEVEVSPADVVAVPIDYNNSKMRVCRYRVLAVVDSEHSSDTHLRVTDDSYKAEDDLNECDTHCGCHDEEKFCECGEFLDDCCPEDMCCDCAERYDTEPCIDCGDTGCFGECEDEEDDDYPFENELE